MVNALRHWRSKTASKLRLYYLFKDHKDRAKVKGSLRDREANAVVLLFFQDHHDKQTSEVHRLTSGGYHPTSKMYRSTSEVHHSPSEVGASPSKVKRSTSEGDSSTSERHRSTSERHRSTSERHR